MMFILGLLSAFTVSLSLTGLLIRYKSELAILDRPDARKIHTKVMPRTGGIAMFASLSFSYFMIKFLFPGAPGALSGNVSYLFAGAFLIFLLGLYDDIKGINAFVKFMGQIAASLILIKGGFVIDLLTNPFGGSLAMGIFSIPLTVLWVVGVVNAVNLIDGLDGLASGVVSISALFLCVIALYQNNGFIALLTLLITGAHLGFLVFNFYPAKIFMGDCGSMVSGFLLAAIAIAGNRKGAAAITLLIPIVLLMVPLVDTLSAIIRRAHGRKNIFQADKEHLHHRLIHLGVPYRKTLFIIYAICVYLGLVALLTLFVQKEFMFILLINVGITILIGLVILSVVEKVLVETRKKYRKKER